MKHSKIVSLSILLIFYTLSSCFEGDPGPQGDQGTPGVNGDNGLPAYDTLKMGYFQGTVAGIRKDGTPFLEAFKYNFANGEDVFEGTNNESIDLYRYDISSPGNRSLKMYLKLVNKNAATETLVARDEIDIQTDFSFSKEAEQNKLFIVKARTYPADVAINVIEISNQLNDQYYHFSKQYDGKISIQKTWIESSSAPVNFIASAEYNSVGISVYYSGSGSLASVGTPQGPVNSGPLFDLYNRLVIKYNPEFDMYNFHDATTGESLHGGGGPIPGDKLFISNYVRDLSTGIITFDFEITVDGERGWSTPGVNSTVHDLTIKGQFNSGSKVYTEVI